MTITSHHNERLKDVRKLAQRRWRERSGRFVAEGEDLLAAADAAGWRALERYAAVGSGLAGTAVEADVLAHVSQLGSGTRTLGVFEQRWAPAPAGPLCVALHGIADPGNVGTVLRAALAFGAASVALGPGCADPYGPKAVRASMGAVFAVPVARFETVADLPGTIVALDAHGATPLAGPLAQPVTLLAGAERAGLPADVLAAADATVAIPIRSESLNAAMAATVALYEATRGQVGAGDAGTRQTHRMGAA
jgi:TrmH family RNA methyltransferase